MQIASLKSPVGNRFPWLRSKKCSALSRYVGIDVGIDEAHVVAMGGRRRDTMRDGHDDGSLRWLSQHRFSIPVDPLAPPPQDWVQRTISTILNRLPRCVDGDPNIAAVSLPLPWVHYQVNSPAEIDACQQQCDAMFASSLFQSSAHLSFWPSTGDQYVVAATAEAAAFELAQAVSDLGYDLQGMLPHGQALVGAAAAMTGIEPVCVVQLNRSGGLIAINQAGRCGLCRTLPAIPHSVLTASPHRIMLESIGSWLANIGAEISATIRYSAVSRPNEDSQQPVLICGDIAAIENVDAVLATHVNRPVAQWRYAGRTRPHGGSTNTASDDGAPENPAPESFAHDCEFALALSLAFAAAQKATGGDAE